MSTRRKLDKKLAEERKKFKPYEGKNESERHIRLTKFMFDSEPYQALSNNAKTLYNYMKLWAYGSNEFKQRNTFDYSVSLAACACRVSKKTAIMCFRELETGGFIERQNNSAASRQVSKWTFSDKWWKARP